MGHRQHQLPWPCAAIIISIVLLSGQCTGQPKAAAPAPTEALVSTRSDWTDLREAGGHGAPATAEDLGVPSTGIQLGVQLAGPAALATDDVMESVRSVLSQVLPVTYSDVDPQAYKNVTVCSVGTPTAAPPQQDPGQPGNLAQNKGRLLLQHDPHEASGMPLSNGTILCCTNTTPFQVWGAQDRRSLLQTPGSGGNGAQCENKMRAVFMLRRSLSVASYGNASAVQKTVRDAFNSGFLLARAKRSKLDVVSMDLLVYQDGGTSGIIYPSSEGLGQDSNLTMAAGPATAPAPAIGADAQWSINHPGSSNNGTTDVFFTLILTGQDALETNAGLIKQLSYLLTDVLNTGDIDYLTDENTAVIYEDQLPQLTAGTPGRRLLSAGLREEAEQVEGEMVPVSDAERKALSAWLKRGRHSKRGDRSAHTDHPLLFRRLLQAPKPPQLPQSPMAGAPDGDPAQIVYAGPVNALSVTYRVASVQQPGPAVIAQKLGYFIETGQAVSQLQKAGYKVGNVQLAKFTPLPGAPVPAPGALALSGAPADAPEPTAAAAGIAGMKFAGKLVLGIVLPISLLAIAAAAVFAYLFFKYKRRYADSERPIKDSAQSMENSDKKSLPVSSGSGGNVSGGLRSSSGNHRSSSGGIRGIMENLSRSQDVTGQEALAMASLAKKSMTLPGMQSDWEIDPDELEIANRPDGSEWRLGSGASAHVYKAFRNGVQVVAVKIFTDQVPGENQARYAEAFRREIFILRSCHDRNIVQFLGACLQVGQTILVQEYMENGDLFHAISEDMAGRFGWYRRKQPTGRPIPNTGMARRIALDTARGLFFLHSRRIVHFDLKSANVLLGRDWTAKIADVGLAKILKDGWLSTLREVGTFSWAAPEVLLGKPCTEKVDIYSYGVLLWELSAGEAPPGRNLRPLKVPEECPADVEAMIARCLDSNPDKRPSARELVEFMVQLPQQFSMDGSAIEGSNELSPSVNTNGNSEQMLTHGQSLPSVTPRPPPGGMVLPNAFGLMSMKSFTRSNSSKTPSTQESGNAKPSATVNSGAVASGKPQKTGASLPGSAFKSLRSMSFKRKPSQGGLETTVEESSGSIDRELKNAVARSNSSFREAAEGRRIAVSPMEATRAAATVKGEGPHDTSELKDQRTVQPADGSCAGPDSRSAQPDGDTGVVRQDASHRSPAQGRPPVRSAFDSRDSASEVQNAPSASMAEQDRQSAPAGGRLPVSSAFAPDEQGHASSSQQASSHQKAPPQKPWRLPFMSAFAADSAEEEPERREGSVSLGEAPQRARQLPFSSSISAEPSTGIAEPGRVHEQGQQKQPGRPVPSAFAAGEPNAEAQPGMNGSSAPEQVLPRQQPHKPFVSAFAADAPGKQHASAQPSTRPYVSSAFASNDSIGSSRGVAPEEIQMSERGNLQQAPVAARISPSPVKSPIFQEG